MPRGRDRSDPGQRPLGRESGRGGGAGLTPRAARAAIAVAALFLSSCSTSPPVPTAPESAGTERGLASWYGAEFANLPTASGEIFRPEKVSAAHRTLPLGTVVDVTNEKNGKTVRVRINDRGPFIAGRIVDLSKAAASEIDSVGDGVVPVTLRVVTYGTNERIRAADAGDAAAAFFVEPPLWAVQAGAFGNEENARRLCDRLGRTYAKAWIEEYEGLRRVKFGPYRSRAEADAARDSLADLGLAGIVVPHR